MFNHISAKAEILAALRCRLILATPTKVGAHPVSNSTSPSLSFADAIRRSNPHLLALAQKINLNVEDIRSELAIFLSDTDISAMSDPLKISLVRKFAKGRPKLDVIRDLIRSIGFKGDYSIGVIDTRHILLRFAQQDDYH